MVDVTAVCAFANTISLFFQVSAVGKARVFHNEGCDENNTKKKRSGSGYFEICREIPTDCVKNTHTHTHAVFRQKSGILTPLPQALTEAAHQPEEAPE